MASEDDLSAIKLLLLAILITLLGWWSVIGAVIGILLFVYALAVMIFKVDNILQISTMYNYISNLRRSRELKKMIHQKRKLGYETPELNAELEFQR